MGRMKMLPADYSRLKEALAKCGVEEIEASLGMGYAANSLSNVKYRSVISSSMAKALEVFYGIKYEDIAPKTYNPEQVAFGLIRTPEGPNRELYEVIYKAVYDAIKDGMQG